MRLRSPNTTGMPADLMARTSRVEARVRIRAAIRIGSARCPAPARASPTSAITTARNPFAITSSFRRSNRSMTTPMNGLMNVYGR